MQNHELRTCPNLIFSNFGQSPIIADFGQSPIRHYNACEEKKEEEKIQLLSDSNHFQLPSPTTATIPHHAPFSLKIGPIMSYFCPDWAKA